jgi:hypothetical protein
MRRTNTWVLGATPEIDLRVYDREDHTIDPVEVRLSIETPTGEVLTFSGMDLQTASGYLYYIYHPTVRGWYSYEVWAKDVNGVEGTSDVCDANGFEIVDIIGN